MPGLSAICCPFHRPSTAHSIGRFYQFEGRSFILNPSAGHSWIRQPSGGCLLQLELSTTRSWSGSLSCHTSGDPSNSRGPSTAGSQSRAPASPSSERGTTSAARSSSACSVRAARLQLPSMLLYTDASQATGWGAHLLDLTASGVWSEKESQECINVLKWRVVDLALLPQLAGQCVVLMSDIMPVQVASLRHQGSTVSRRVCLMTFTITQWTERHSVLLEPRYVPGKKNVLADQLSQPDQILPTEWSLLPQVFEELCRVFGKPHLNLFAARANAKLPLCVANFGSSSLEARRSSSLVGPSVHLCLHPVCAATSGHHTGSGVGGSVIGSRSSPVPSEGVVCRSAGSSCG